MAKTAQTVIRSVAVDWIKTKKADANCNNDMLQFASAFLVAYELSQEKPGKFGWHDFCNKDKCDYFE